MNLFQKLLKIMIKEEVDIYSKNGVLINRLGIKEQELLDQAEVDITSSTIYKTINESDFELSSKGLREVNKKIFGDIYPFAGNYRKVNLIKPEYVLKGLSVKYVDSRKIAVNINRILNQQKKIEIEKLNYESLVNNIANLIIRLWQTHPFREGNTRTIVVFIIKYLQNSKIDCNINIPTENICYIRDALVRAVFEDEELNFYKNDTYIKKITRGTINNKKN